MKGKPNTPEDVPWKGYGKGNGPARPVPPVPIGSWLKKENKGIPKKKT